jgi:hypothetical protein
MCTVKITGHRAEGMGHLGTLNGYSRRVPKPRYSPPDADAAARIQRVVELHRRVEQAEAEYKKALAEVVDPERDAVPIAFMARELRLERKTVYRHLGRSMT